MKPKHDYKIIKVVHVNLAVRSRVLKYNEHMKKIRNKTNLFVCKSQNMLSFHTVSQSYWIFKIPIVSQMI